MRHVILYAGHLYQPFWTIKIRPGRQEGPGKVKMHWYTCSIKMTQMCHILKYPVMLSKNKLIADKRSLKCTAMINVQFSAISCLFQQGPTINYTKRTIWWGDLVMMLLIHVQQCHKINIMMIWEWGDEDKMWKKWIHWSDDDIKITIEPYDC